MERGEHRIKIDGGLWDAWKLYKSKKIDTKIDRKTYVEICKAFNIKISDKIVRESYEFRMPFRLGYIRIKSRKHKIVFKNGKLDTSKMPIDWNTTWETWREDYPDLTDNEIKQIPNKKLIVHTNEHSNGFIMKWYWDRRVSNVRNQFAYIFYPVKGGERDNYFYGRRGLAKWIKSDERTNEYFL